MVFKIHEFLLTFYQVGGYSRKLLSEETFSVCYHNQTLIAPYCLGSCESKGSRQGGYFLEPIKGGAQNLFEAIGRECCDKANIGQFQFLHDLIREVAFVKNESCLLADSCEFVVAGYQVLGQLWKQAHVWSVAGIDMVQKRNLELF